MPTPNELSVLRDVNRNLRAALVRLLPERNCAAIARGELSDLLAQVVRASECLHLAPGHGQPLADFEADFEVDFENEKLDYRRNLESLKQLLPGLHLRLLAEKARLEAARVQVSGAAAWAEARRKTL